MLGRIKFAIEPLVNEILDQLPPEVWTSKTTTFFDPAMGGGQFVKEIERRLREAGHTDANISGRVYGCETSLLSVKYALNKYKLVGNYVVCDFLKQDFGNMKFDRIVANPPYQHENTTGANSIPTTLYIDFVEKIMNLSTQSNVIIPSGWLFKNVKRMDTLLKTGKYLKKIKLLNDSVFGVGMSVCYVEIDKAYIGETVVIDEKNHTTKVDFTKKKFITKDAKSNKIVSKIESKTKVFLGNRWVRGLATRTTKDDPSGDLKLVLSVGSKEIVSVKSKIETTGKDKWKVGFPSINGDLTSIGYTEVYGKDHVCGKSVVFLVVDTKNEAENLKNLLNTPIYKFLVSKTKSAAANSKTLFNRFPEVDLARSWTDQELYKHFGLTQEEIDYIEANVK